MATQQHLSKAPITEALIDLRVTLPKHTGMLEHLAGLKEKLHEQYPDKKNIEQFMYHFEIGPPQIDRRTSTQLGFRFANTDSNQVIQATLNGFTFSRLPPYLEWSKLLEETQRVWRIYSDHVRPENITRVATRYINKLILPGPPVDFEHYLSYVPIVPKVLPQTVAEFSSRLVVPDEKAQTIAIITQQFQPSPTETAVILDIDVFKEKIFASEDEAWMAIHNLREFKNLIFFDSITDKTVTLYK